MRWMKSRNLNGPFARIKLEDMVDMIKASQSCLFLA